MEKNKKAMPDGGRGFTLIELLVSIAIIIILAAVVLVSMSSFAKKARSSKALSQLSSVIPSMVSCWGNNKEVKNPSSGGAICKDAGIGGADATTYGYWPQTAGDLSKYSYGVSSLASKSSWYFSLESNSTNDDVGICCNSTLASCKIIGQPVTVTNCSASLPAN